MANARHLESGEDRTWRLLLTTGAVFGFVFLVLQISDWWSDRAHPAMRANDLKSAAASLAMLAIVGVIAARRAQMGKPAAPIAAPVVRVRVKKKKKPGAAIARRKRRA